MASLEMNKLPWWGQLLVFAVISGAGVFAYYKLYEWPQREILATRQAELSAIQARIATGLETARKLPEFRAQVGDLEARLDSLRAILPEQKDVADLLRRIQTMASQSNLTIRTFKPQAMAQKELHAEWPIGLELEGTYHNVGEFLDRVSKFPRIINVGAIAMNGNTTPTPQATVRVSCTATTFVLTDREPQTGAPAPSVPAKTE
ncbi:MAG: type 4a pilus biogenesis protein PilO [Vicinamibacterales bacterium]